jgi:hypothetical protein
VTINTVTITVYLKEKSASFLIYRSGSHYQLSLDYFRLEFSDLPLANFIDLLIYDKRLSGEKHIIKTGSFTEFTYFHEGKVVDSDKNISPSHFDLFLLREAIFGHVHLALDELIQAQRLGDTEKVNKIKQTLNRYQKQIANLNEQLNL